MLPTFPSPARAAAALAAAAVLLVAAPAALGATKPTVSTGAAHSIAPTSAVVTGTVNPGGLPTTFYVQYGPTKAYGLQSGTGELAPSASSHPVAIPLSNLAANTLYHYRVVAGNDAGFVMGADRTLTTARVPLSLGQIVVTPSPVPYGSAATLQGILSGTGNGGREVVLQASTWPFLAGYAQVGNPEVTLANGAYTFVLPPLLVDANFRVVTTSSPAVVSSVAYVGVSVQVSARARVHRLRRGAQVTVSGRVAPAENGALVYIQKLFGRSGWRTLRTVRARGTTGNFSVYSGTARVSRGGFFRAFARIADNGHLSAASGPLLVSTRR